jgi:Tfp pilus assembly protein PilP
MTWKSTAAASGAMVVATWLASYAPVGGPRTNAPSVPSAAHTETAAAEIQREADRLHSRLNRVASYKVPSRNPFRFGERPPAPVPVRQPVAPREVPPVVEPEPPAIRMVLAGIAEDVVDEQVMRTAIISAPDNVHIVKVGDTIGDVYKVTAIEADAVELSRLADGSALRLSLRR